MKFKIDADVTDQSRDMPILSLNQEDETEMFYYDKLSADAIKLQLSDMMHDVRTATLDHPDLLFAKNSKVITGIDRRVRMGLSFSKTVPFTEIITEKIIETYGKRTLCVVYHIWIGDKSMTASFAPIDDLYRNKVRNHFIDSFIDQL